MKTLAVCCSLTGNTLRAARRIGEALGAGVPALECVKPYPSRGAQSSRQGGKSAVMEETPPLCPRAFRLEDNEQIVFGFPVWAGSVAPPLRTFIRENEEALRDKALAAFACRDGSGGEKALGKLLACLGEERFRAELILTDPGKGGADGRDAQIAAFCEKLR